MKQDTKIGFALAVTLGTALLASGCASTAGSFRTLNPATADTMAHYSKLGVRVDAGSGVPLNDSDKERIRDMIMRNLDSELQGRFKLMHGSDDDGGGLEADVLIKRYDEGNAFARMMLAGLGAMHIDADVTLVDRKSNDAVARYEVTKTFAWGGAYGGGTSIRDIEDGFAKAVATAIGGKEH